MSEGTSLVPVDRIERAILLIRGQKVLLDEDLAELYEVETGALVRAVKRNIDRFPEDFMFQLTREEYEGLRCQIGISNPPGRGGRRYLPYAFTEQGVAMLSSVLRSPISSGAIAPEVSCKSERPPGGGLGSIPTTQGVKWLLETLNARPPGGRPGIDPNLTSRVRPDVDDDVGGNLGAAWDRSQPGLQRRPGLSSDLRPPGGGLGSIPTCVNLQQFAANVSVAATWGTEEGQMISIRLPPGPGAAKNNPALAPLGA